MRILENKGDNMGPFELKRRREREGKKGKGKGQGNVDEKGI